jgi:hypothetical protein
MLNIGQNYWILKIVYWRVVMMTCLNIVVVNQMINRTGAVKLKKYYLSMDYIMYGWINVLILKSSYLLHSNIKWYSSSIEFVLQLKQNLSFLLML